MNEWVKPAGLPASGIYHIGYRTNGKPAEAFAIGIIVALDGVGDFGCGGFSGSCLMMGNEIMMIPKVIKR